MENAIQKRVKRAKNIGSLYFIFLALFNLSIAIESNNLIWISLIIVLFSIVPLVSNSKRFVFFYGVLALVISSIILFAYAASNRTYVVAYNDLLVQNIFGFGLAILSISASLLLLYASMNHTEKTFKLP